MQFTDREVTGKLLAKMLKPYKDKDVVVYALPRGGVVPAYEIAKSLHAPLDLIITRKIGHPDNPEFAIAAISEKGEIVGNFTDLLKMNKYWLKTAIAKELKEAMRRRNLYSGQRNLMSPKGKIAILVDDGVATGLTMQAAIQQLKHYDPKKIVVAVPVIPESIATTLKTQVDEMVALIIAPNNKFSGSISAYYLRFPQVSDKEVIRRLKPDMQKTFSMKKTDRHTSETTSL